MPESTSLKRNTDNEVLPQGYSTELADWKEVIVDQEGKQYVRDTEVLSKLTEMDNKLQTLEDTVEDGNQKVAINGNIVTLSKEFKIPANSNLENFSSVFDELEWSSSVVNLSDYKYMSFSVATEEEKDFGWSVPSYPRNWNNGDTHSWGTSPAFNQDFSKRFDESTNGESRRLICRRMELVASAYRFWLGNREDEEVTFRMELRLFKEGF